MSIASEHDLAAVAFAEPIDDSSVWTSDSSAFSDARSRNETRENVGAGIGSRRWYVALLGRLKFRFKRPTNFGVNRELAGLQRFRQRFADYLGATVREQNEQLCGLLASIKSSAVSIIYLHEVVLLAVKSPGANSFDLAVDFLSNFDHELWEVFQSFLQTDRVRWHRSTPSGHINDDVGYILLRALARSNVSTPNKAAAIGECLVRGTVGIREAATHAFADLGGEEARAFLMRAAESDSDESVRDSAREALSDFMA